jgi:ubiquinone biosynthesis protein COQ4
MSARALCLSPTGERPEPFAMPAPKPHRPVQWRRAWRVLRELIADPERTELVFELFDAVGGDGHERCFRAFATSREGRRLLHERPCLVAAMADRGALARLPEGSFGRAYLDFASARDFAADGLVAINRAQNEAEGDVVDPVRHYYMERVTAMHDLWHVLTGYGTDDAGEATLLAFSVAQIPSRGLWVLVVAALWLLPKGERWRCQRYVARAWLRGRRAFALDRVRYEDLLGLPLDEARRCLGIEPAGEAHPGGILVGRKNGEARWVEA